jgi:hypothetical protein
MTFSVMKGVSGMKRFATVFLAIGFVAGILQASGIVLAAGEEGVSPSSESCVTTDTQPSPERVAGDEPLLIAASNPCGSNLSCGFNTGCAPGKTACCPRSAPNLNMCNCGCYAKTNYNTSKGGCNV